MRIPRYAIVPSNGRKCLWDSVAAIAPQVDWVYVIYTGSGAGDLWDTGHKFPGNFSIGFVGPEDPNISRWWNKGLELAEYDPARKPSRSPKWDVAVINDDAIVPEGWFDAISGTMRQMGVAAGCSGSPVGMPVLHTQPGPVGLETRLQGFAFILAGERGLRANEELRWFFTDDYIDWESRKLGGMVMVPGFHVNHLYPNGQLTPELHEAIAQDAQKFVDIYGMRPW